MARMAKNVRVKVFDIILILPCGEEQKGLGRELTKSVVSCYLYGLGRRLRLLLLLDNITANR